MKEIENVLFVEKYRPRTLDDCILPKATKDTLKSIVNSGNPPHLILAGGPGIGKTTVARALANDMGMTSMLINGSNEGRLIDTLRTRISSFASTVSLDGGMKQLIIDEADGMPPLMQESLRSFMEEFSGNCRFVFTANYKRKLIDPLWSRSTIIDFEIPAAQQEKLMLQLYRRLIEICEKEGIVVESDAALIKLMQRRFPDIRRILNELQSHSSGTKTITSDILSVSNSVGDYATLVSYLKNKQFTKMRQWVAENSGDPQEVFRHFYDHVLTYLSPKSVPDMVVLLGEYGYKSSMVADQEINMAAFFVEVMANMEWAN